jgi:hypothetical protein
MTPKKLKPDAAPIRDYHATLKTYADHDASHEGATETVFESTGRHFAPARLDADSEEEKDRRRQDHLPRWHAARCVQARPWLLGSEDTSDDLDAEIQKKIDKKYPLTNTIFEDTRKTVLYQNGKESQRFDLAKTKDVADLPLETTLTH